MKSVPGMKSDYYILAIVAVTTTRNSQTAQLYRIHGPSDPSLN